MKAFRLHEGIACPIDPINVDTDQILPARFLQKRRLDPLYSKFLFHDLRFDGEGNEIENFSLNKTHFRDSSILVGNENFGGGSSREAAVFALEAYGIVSIIAPNFGDIFYANCVKNGILPVVLPPDCAANIRTHLNNYSGAKIQINLVEQKIIYAEDIILDFHINEFDRNYLLRGSSQISNTLQHLEMINNFEVLYKKKRFWVDDFLK